MTTKKTPFQSILVANRGEIAVRVMRTAKALGLRTIAVYSEADRSAVHVKMADDAYLLGPAPVGESYLNMERVLEAIRETGAEAVHPGYGFLSENAAFAQACADHGAIFIGPSAQAIELMGDKAQAKRLMLDAGIPCIPGYQGEDQTDATLLSEAKTVGFPLMVKAAAGGGGRGMRLVPEESELSSAITTARSEAENAFGCGDLILERAIIEPRHVEIQVFADQFGATIHLGERDCSVQRRHQKVLEEAPCPVMTPALREQMGAAAVKAAQDINYVGAGTVEFLLDQEGSFYFLEMNTRLQVEHPVTELVTGLDLVAMQIRVARGEALNIDQKDISIDGHAIEARLYAEDPTQDFLPATGPVDLWSPASGDGVRVDAGIATGDEISHFYDPMIAKIVANGATREEARAKLVAALKDTAIFGVTTNKSFLIDALEHPTFSSGDATTAFIQDNCDASSLAAPLLTSRVAAIAAALLYTVSNERCLQKSLGVPSALLNWASATAITTPYRFSAGEEDIVSLVTPQGATHVAVSVGDAVFDIDVLELNDTKASLLVDGARQTVRFVVAASAMNAHHIQLKSGMRRSRSKMKMGSPRAPLRALMLVMSSRPCMGSWWKFLSAKAITLKRVKSLLCWKP